MAIFAKIFNKINLGIGILESVAKCTTVMNQIRHLPWYFTAAAVGIGAFFLSIIVRGFSIGSITTVQAISKFEKDKNNSIRYRWWICENIEL